MLKYLWPWSKSDGSSPPPPLPDRPSDPSWPLSDVLVSFSRHDHLTVGRAVEGVLILGATGSGKSSGSGRTIAMSYLYTGWGGLVLCAKPDERRTWERYCEAAGRTDDLIIFGPDRPWRFNFLDYELNRSGAGAGLTENLVNLFSSVLEVAERNSGQSGGGDEGYWRRANRQLVRNLIELLALAKGRVSIPDLYRLAVSAPTSLEQVRSPEWMERSFCFRCLGEGDKKPKTPRQQSDFEIVADFFMFEWPGLSEKTRSVVLSTFTSMADVLNRGVLRELFCGETNVTPEAIERGAIIVVDLSVKEYAEIGQFAAVLLKNAFQRSIERRNVIESPRPVFLWQDEGQLFTTSYDMQFQTTCRAARVSTVVLSQNVSNFYAVMSSGDKGRAEADSLFGNLNLKIFHANGDHVTNEWAASMIGRCKQFMVNANNNYGDDDAMSLLIGGGPQNGSAGVTEIWEHEVQPAAFTQLRTGGPANDWCVDAIVFANGTRFKATGKTWMPVTFSQN